MASRFGLSDEDIAKRYNLTCQSIPEGERGPVNFDL